MPDPSGARVLPFRKTGAIVLAVVAVVMLDLLVLAFVAATEGAARLGMIALAATMVAASVWVIVALPRRAVVLDGSRIGWRNGFTGVGSWTERDDIVYTTRNIIGPRHKPVTNLVLWTRAGGMHGINTLVARLGMMPADRTRLKSLTRSVKLRPFVVPLTDLGGQRAAEVEDWLARR